MLHRSRYARTHFGAVSKCLRSLHDERYLITGAVSRLGQNMASRLRSVHGAEKVVATDLALPTEKFRNSGPWAYCNTDVYNNLAQIAVGSNISQVIHLTHTLSSAEIESDPVKNVNRGTVGLHNIFHLAREHQLSVFAPSTISVFGRTTLETGSDHDIMEPETITGIVKVHLELLGKYYHEKYGVNFRSVRVPDIMWAGWTPRLNSGTTDMFSEAVFAAAQGKTYSCYLPPEVTLPHIHGRDALRGMLELMDAPEECLTRRVYNISSFSMSVFDLFAALRKRVPGFKVTYQLDPLRTRIAESWPSHLDDSAARRDWGWAPEYDADATLDLLLERARHSPEEWEIKKVVDPHWDAAPKSYFHGSAF